MKHPRYFTIHGHFYQPPRENPWIGAIESQPSASPSHDWNQRIAKECYSPNSASRILDPYGRIQDMVNNYEYMSFNIGPTLMSWIRHEMPNAYRRIQEADRRSAERLNGHGNAIAQVYNHMIMPLATPEDRLTQIRWGIKDFEFHFGRKPEAMWLAETAINMDTVVDLIREGIRYTILSPTQAESFRSLGKSEWIDCANTDIDTTRPYRIIPKDAKGNRLCEGHLDVFFYHPWLSSAVGFEHLLRSADTYGSRILDAFDHNSDLPQMISVATDGESYGHHEAFGDMCAAWLFSHYAPEHDMRPVNYGWYLEQFPPAHEVLLKNVHGEGCAWSCAHGVGRWYRDCGCSTGGPGTWNQEWRTPLRESLNALKKQADKVFVSEWGRLANTDPWEARDKYIKALLHPASVEVRRDLIMPQLNHQGSREDFAQALRLLEMQKFCLFSFTSCGWFFNDIEGIEPVQNLRYALRAMELLQPFLGWGESVESHFLGIIARATANQSGRNGAELFADEVRPKIPAWLRQLGEAAVRMHLQLESPHGYVQDLFQVTLEQHKQSPERSLFQFHIEQLETLESFNASVVVQSDSLGRTYLATLEGGDSWQRISTIDPTQSVKDIERKHPKVLCMRMRDLFIDSLHRINQMASERGLKQIAHEFKNFAQRHSLSLDCAADPSNALPEALRQSLAVALNAEIHRLAMQSLVHVKDELLTQSKELIDEAHSLHIALTMGGLGTMFHSRLKTLVTEAVADPVEDTVLQITGLISLADWMRLDIDKTSLENLAFESYKELRKSPTSKWARLAPMYEWLNFSKIEAV